MQRLPDFPQPAADRHFGWRTIDGRLTVAGTPLNELLQQWGSPCYVISRERIDERIAEVRAALPRATELLYPVKANPVSYTHLFTATSMIAVASRHCEPG